MYQNFNPKDAMPLPSNFTYRGLTFPLYEGTLSKDELRSGYTFFAFYGNTKATRLTIRFMVDQMIESGRYREAA